MKRQTLENAIRAHLANYPADQLFTVRAHELWRADAGGWSSNDRFTIARDADLARVLEVCRDRWEVFKANYSPRARVADLADVGYDLEYGINLECNFLPFVDIEPSNP